MKTLNPPQPIIVRRIIKKGKPHGGAWKVAFADFAVAMMAFFLVLWLNEAASDKEKQAISGYFEDPIAFLEGGSPAAIDLGGSVSVRVVDNTSAIPVNQPEIRLGEKQAQDIVDQIEKTKLEKLMGEIIAQIEKSPNLKEFSDQLKLDLTDEGLRIQIVDKQGRPMFDTGAAALKDYSREIINELAPTIAQVKNRIVLSGHTDARPFPGFAGYSNWELSSDRANAARRALVEGGLPETRISRVVGLASSSLYDQSDAYNPINRRITILVLNRRTELTMDDAEHVTPEDIEEIDTEALFDSGMLERLQGTKEPPLSTHSQTPAREQLPTDANNEPLVIDPSQPLDQLLERLDRAGATKKKPQLSVDSTSETADKQKADQDALMW